MSGTDERFEEFLCDVFKDRTVAGVRCPRCRGDERVLKQVREVRGRARITPRPDTDDTVTLRRNLVHGEPLLGHLSCTRVEDPKRSLLPLKHL